MSQLNNEPQIENDVEQSSETPAESSMDSSKENVMNSNDKEKQPEEESESSSDEQVKDEPKEEAPKPEAKKPKKKLSKGTKIAIGMSTWLLLIGGAVGLAFYLRPTADTVHIAPEVEEFKWEEPESEVELDLVDVDYYGYYNTNALYFEKATEDYTSKYANIVYVRGLKNKAVENKINDRIKSIVDELSANLDKDYYTIQMSPAANLANILSIRFAYNTYDNMVSHYYTYGVTFDLSNGNELTFDDIFIDKYDYTQYIHKAFYDHLSTELSFRRQDVAKIISTYEKDPSSCSMYSVTCNVDNPQEIIQHYYDDREKINTMLANIEQYSFDEAKKYIDSDNKQFYLNAYGPVFIFNNGEDAAESEAGEQAKYLAYYRDYRTASSLFEDSSRSINHIFYTTNISYPSWTDVSITETDSYLLEESTIYDKKYPNEFRIYKDYILERLMKKVEVQPQFYWIQINPYVYQAGSSGRLYNYYVANADIEITTTSRDYYHSTFRKAIIDGKTQKTSMGPFQPARVNRYDKDKIQEFTAKDIKSIIGGGTSMLIDSQGVIYKSAEEIFEPGSDWLNYIKNYMYSRIGHYDNGTFVHEHYTEEEKASHDIGVILNGGDLLIGIKDDSTQNTYGFSKQTYLPIYHIPNEYLKESFRR